MRHYSEGTINNSKHLGFADVDWPPAIVCACDILNERTYGSHHPGGLGTLQFS